MKYINNFLRLRNNRRAYRGKWLVWGQYRALLSLENMLMVRDALSIVSEFL